MVHPHKHKQRQVLDFSLCVCIPGRVTNIPVGMVTDQFGMIGLLTFIRAAETDPGMVHLALGSDLTTLGLNLNSPEYDTHTDAPMKELICFSFGTC